MCQPKSHMCGEERVSITCILEEIVNESSSCREDMCSSLTAGVQSTITETAIKLGYYISTVHGKKLLYPYHTGNFT